MLDDAARHRLARQLSAVNPERLAAIIVAHKVMTQAVSNLGEVDAEGEVVRRVSRECLRLRSDLIARDPAGHPLEELLAALRRRADAGRKATRVALSALAAAGVSFMLLKGTATELNVGRGLRDRNDTDILLLDLAAAWRLIGLLAPSGAEFECPWLRLLHAPDGQRHVGGQINVHLPAGGEVAILDAHFGQYCTSLFTGLAPAGMWARARRGEFDGVPALIPTLEDQLLLLAAHACSHGYYTFKDVNDVAVIAATPGLDWSLVTREVRDSGLTFILADLLALAGNRCHGNPGIPRELRGGGRGRFFRLRPRHRATAFARWAYRALYSWDRARRGARLPLLMSLRLVAADATAVIREVHFWPRELPTWLADCLLFLSPRKVAWPEPAPARTVFLAVVQQAERPVDLQVLAQRLSAAGRPVSFWHEADAFTTLLEGEGRTLELVFSPVGAYMPCADLLVRDKDLERAAAAARAVLEETSSQGGERDGLLREAPCAEGKLNAGRRR